MEDGLKQLIEDGCELDLSVTASWPAGSKEPNVRRITIRLTPQTDLVKTAEHIAVLLADLKTKAKAA